MLKREILVPEKCIPEFPWSLVDSSASFQGCLSQLSDSSGMTMGEPLSPSLRLHAWKAPECELEAVENWIGGSVCGGVGQARIGS